MSNNRKLPTLAEHNQDSDSQDIKSISSNEDPVKAQVINDIINAPNLTNSTGNQSTDNRQTASTANNSSIQQPQENAPSRGAYKGKSKYTAAFFAIIFGSIGLHKFYLGKWVQGIIYFLFIATGLPTVIGIIEGLRYLFMSKENFDNAYNYDDT